MARHLRAPVNKIRGTCNRRVSMKRLLSSRLKLKSPIKSFIAWRHFDVLLDHKCHVADTHMFSNKSSNGINCQST